MTESIITVCRLANKYTNDQAPWELIKTEQGQGRLGTVLFVLAETIRRVAVLFEPVMPGSCGKILNMVGAEEGADLRSFASIERGATLIPGTPIQKPTQLFPRIVK